MNAEGKLLSVFLVMPVQRGHFSSLEPDGSRAACPGRRRQPLIGSACESFLWRKCSRECSRPAPVEKGDASHGPCPEGLSHAVTGLWALGQC